MCPLSVFVHNVIQFFLLVILLIYGLIVGVVGLIYILSKLIFKPKRMRLTSDPINQRPPLPSLLVVITIRLEVPLEGWNFLLLLLGSRRAGGQRERSGVMGGSSSKRDPVETIMRQANREQLVRDLIMRIYRNPDAHR